MIMKWLLAPALSMGLAIGETAPPPPESVLVLPQELVTYIEQEIVARTESKEERIDLITDLMFREGGLGFEYRDLPTGTAASTYEAGGGNCLSFTLLFMAMARTAGLEAWPREVAVASQWHRDGATIFRIGHVNVGVKGGSRTVTVDFDPDFLRASRLSAQYRGRRISEQRALAHFYNNRAAELLAEGSPSAALEWSTRALEMSPDFASALNTRGVAQRRLGNLDSAESDYQSALKIDPDNADTLFNLIGLNRSRGQTDRVERYREKLASMRSRDPYFHFEVGRLHEELGELETAHDFYRRANRLVDQPDTLILGHLAQITHRLGEDERARDYLSQAISHSGPSEQAAYADKLRALKLNGPEGDGGRP